MSGTNDQKKLKFTKKRFMTLLETLIALGITMLVLSTLTFFYRQIDAVNTQLEKVQGQGFRMRYVENRLASILPQAVSESDAKKDFFFFTTSSTLAFAKQGSPTLMLTYDNGVKLDKLFSNHVLGRLFLSSDYKLCLATWPSPNRWVDGISPPMKKEVLLEGVDELSFGFFVAPEKDWKFSDAASKQLKADSKPAPNAASDQPASVVVKPTPEGQWHPTWSYDYQQLPAMVKVQVTLLDKSTRVFVFPLPKCQRQVVYKQ
ncbi:MAG: type II secretion system GspH family protein [Parachlamydia sp.]|nr:type II secretion system GspH family protein [Parachlamydia sp.]